MEPHGERVDVLREVLRALHRRDERDGLLPAVDYGPPRGLIEASCRAACGRGSLPDLRQLPPSVHYAARVAQLLAAAEVPAVFDLWLARNLRAARSGERVETPIAGCRTHEDVRNRVIVEIDALSSGLDTLGPMILDVVELERVG